MKQKIFFIFGCLLFTYWRTYAQSDPVGVPVGGCKEWRNGHWAEVPCAGSNNETTGKVPAGPTKRQRKIAEYNERVDKANNLKDQANEAAIRNDAKEALRLAKAAQDMINDHKWLKEWIEQLEDYILKGELRIQANDLRNKYYAAGKSYNLQEAYSYLKQASKIDPGSLMPGEKDWLHYIEEEIRKDPRYLETNTGAKNYLTASLENFSQALDTTSLAGGLKITESIDTVLNNSGTDENDENSRLIKKINLLAEKLSWPDDEQLRLKQALDSFNIDGEINLNESERKSRATKVWSTIESRGEIAQLKEKAMQEKGMSMPAAGQQSFQDCALFALANAAGLPYGIVAARAAKLISEAEWRSPEEKSNPQKVIKEEGLNGGEVLFLAEAFGQVEIIRSSDFEETIKGGRPVMINIIPGHQVVLSKTFQHNGKTWYEMIDSNLNGPWERRYLNDEELRVLITENGIAFKPEAGTVPKFLR